MSEPVPPRLRCLAALALLAATPLGIAVAQAPPPANFPGRPPPGPPVDILSLTAEPTTIDPGESTNLRWEVLNAYSLSIEPGLGVVATRGAQRVSPGATTTYTLTATGTGGSTTRAVTVTVRGTVPLGPASATTASAPAQPVPRLTDGKPDLSGLYIAERNTRLAGEVKLVTGAESFRVPPEENDLGAGVACLPPGVPAATMLPFPFQIVHKPDVLVILYEAYHQFRIVPIGREHADYLAPAWMGHSVARWDGDTLVVEVRGFNDKTIVAGHRHTEALRVTERYRRTGHETIEYEAIVEDPNVFAEPLRYAGTLTLHPEWEIGEYVCAENAQDYDALFEE
jgi:hypothetical protein